GRFPIRAQGEGDLGRRMAHAFSLGLASHERVVVIGSDAPTLPPAHLSAAFDALRTRKVVIGPARDGGYYLIGLRGEIPPIFEGIAWGSASVLADTLERLPPRQTHLLPFWFDVDTPDDLRLLAAYLPFLLEEHPDTLPHTRAFLSRIMGTRSER
ncbi:MAG: glycosyltransferase, partial [Deltaproteobacteria bacterium]